VLVYLDGVAVNALEDSDPARGFPSLGAAPSRASGRPAVASSTGTALSPSGAGRSTPVGAAIAAAQGASVSNPTRSSAALPPFDINSIAVSRIAAMEVYPEGAPAQTPYGGGSKCGVVLLWSKPR
jgi:hypothetical protein